MTRRWYERTYPRRWYHKLWPWCKIISLIDVIRDMTDKDLEEIKRPLAQYWEKEWMKVHKEVCILHAALRRKNVVINGMRKKVMRSRKEEV